MVPSSLNGVYPDGNSQVLWEDGDRVFCRGRRLGDDGNPSAVLVVLPAAERPSPSSLDRLAHEYGLKDELDGAWAVQPLELVRDVDRVMLVFADPGGEPIDRLLGALGDGTLFASRHRHCHGPGQGPATKVSTSAITAERPSPSSLDRLAHEYGLKDELDGAWAVQPLELVRDVDRVQMIETGCAKGPGTLGARKETTGPSSESNYPIEQLDISKRLPILCSPPTESLSRSSGHTSI